MSLRTVLGWLSPLLDVVLGLVLLPRVRAQGNTLGQIMAWFLLILGVLLLALKFFGLSPNASH